MTKILIVLVALFMSCKGLPPKSDLAVALSNAIQKGLTSFIEKYIANVEQKLPQTIIKPRPGKYAHKVSDLNPAIIVKALNNFKYVLPDEIPILPLAVAEPSSSNILFYFAISNTRLINVTHFTSNATVNKANNKTAIGINLHLNSSAMQGHYELDVSNYELHLYGNGEYSISINGTDAAIMTNIETLADGSFFMTDFFLNFSIANTKMAMTNLLGGDANAQQLLDVMSDTAPAEVDMIDDIIQQAVNRSVVNFTNSYIANIMTWSDVVSFIYFLADG